MYQSLSARRAWIEINYTAHNHRSQKSLSARRAWIEITRQTYHRYENQVALRKESVDRNYIIKITETAPRVALRKESVDRNHTVQVVVIVMHVALRKESVDRNFFAGGIENLS